MTNSALNTREKSKNKRLQKVPAFMEQIYNGIALLWPTTDVWPMAHPQLWPIGHKFRLLMFSPNKIRHIFSHLTKLCEKHSFVKCKYLRWPQFCKSTVSSFLKYIYWKSQKIKSLRALSCRHDKDVVYVDLHFSTPILNQQTVAYCRVCASLTIKSRCLSKGKSTNHRSLRL